MAENGFIRKMKALKEIIRNAPNEIAILARNHFEESFDLGGYNETPFEKWKERARPNDKRNKGRALLIKTGRLSRSIRIKSVGKRRIVIGTDVVYAKIHNEGGEIATRARSELRPRRRTSTGRFAGGFESAGRGATFKAGKIKIPKRQFMGEDNRLLRKKINAFFITKIKQALL